MSNIPCETAFASMPRMADRREDNPQRGSVTLGMPHLCLGGLSETWLLKELGHRHWLLLADAAGMSVPEFEDVTGERVYAAFTTLEISNAAFAELGEHDVVDIRSRLSRLSRTQFRSVHRLTRVSDGQSVGMVELVSSFVKRTRAGSNHSLARVHIPGMAAVAQSDFARSAAGVAAAVRSGSWSVCDGFHRADAQELARITIDPCPSQDFNGADFLYFSSFQAFIDRAEWSFFRELNVVAATERRRIVYMGNIEPGERIAVVLRASHRRADRLAHWCQILREDATSLAHVFTTRLIRPGRANG